jgi:hypothetical protein
MADRLTIYLLDSGGVPIGILDQATKVSATVRWQDLGAVGVTCRATNPAAAEIIPGTRIAVMVDGAVFASGPLAQIVHDTDSKGVIIDASGPDDMFWLSAAIGYPAAPSLNPNGATSSDISGPAETVIYQYVDRNIGPGSDPGRRRVRFGTTLGRGSTVNESVRFESLLTVAKRLAIVDGFGFRCRWDPVAQGLPLFEVMASRDLEAEIQFSAERGTIAKSTATDIAPSGTHVLVGGSGSGTGRVFAQVNDDMTAANWYRVESFVDAGDVSDVGTLTQRAQDVMQQGGRTISLEAIETEGMMFGRDWRLGDIVTGIAGRFESVFVIVQVELTGPPLRFKPTLAEFSGYRTGQLAAVQQRVLAERLRSQETN